MLSEKVRTIVTNFCEKGYRTIIYHNRAEQANNYTTDVVKFCIKRYILPHFQPPDHVGS
jgi:hypothetical protein